MSKQQQLPLTMQHGSNFQATPQRMLGTRSTPPPPAPQQPQMSQSNRSLSPHNNGQISSSMGSGQNPAPAIRGQLNQLMMGIIEHGAHGAHANVNRQQSAVSSSYTQNPY